MDDFERGLSTALKSTPPPPTEIDPGDIVGGSGPRRPAWKFVAPLLAAVLVAAVAVSVLLAAHSGSHPPTTVPAGPPDRSHSTATESPALVVVPYVVSLRVAKAEHVLEQSDLRWVVTPVHAPMPKGVVVAQAPSAYSHLVGGSTVFLRVSNGTDLAWARTCIPPSFGPVTRVFDGLTVAAARARARHHREVMDFRAANGSCDIGSIPITAGPTYIHAAIENGRVVFARVSKAHPSS